MFHNYNVCEKGQALIQSFGVELCVCMCVCVCVCVYACLCMYLCVCVLCEVFQFFSFLKKKHAIFDHNKLNWSKVNKTTVA